MTAKEAFFNSLLEHKMAGIIIKQRCYCRMRAQKGENAIFIRSLQNRRNDSTVMREMLDDIFTVFLTKDAWRVWVGLMVLWLVVCLFAKVR